MRTLTISGTPYQYPDAGETPGWGEDATEWAQAITDAVNSLTGPNDIPTTTALIADNVVVPTNVNGMSFATPGTKSFSLFYVIQRSNGTTASNEYGALSGVYTGTDWLMDRNYVGESGVDLTITATGQVKYTSSSIGGVYTGVITFKTSSSAF